MAFRGQKPKKESSVQKNTAFRGQKRQENHKMTDLRNDYGKEKL